MKTFVSLLLLIVFVVAASAQTTADPQLVSAIAKIKAIDNHVSGLKVTASGGISSLEDIRRVSCTRCGIDSMIVGKALYEKYFTIQEALVAGNQ